MRQFILAVGLLFGLQSFSAMAPAFQGELLGGGKTSLQKQLKPNRALLVCFWATWCVPCMEELKIVTEKMKKETEAPFDILTVNINTGDITSDVKPTLKLYQLDLPVILDPKHEIFTKYQQAQILPYSVLVKPNGEIAKVFSGLNENMFEESKEIASKLKVADGR